MIEHLDVEKRVVFIPQEVVEMVIRQEMPLVKAWRLFKDLSVQEVAESSDLKKYEVEELEEGENDLSFRLEKVARGMGLEIEQLTDL
jgi:hypothetical protein